VTQQQDALNADITKQNNDINAALADARQSKDQAVDQEAQQTKAKALQQIAIDQGHLADSSSINTNPGSTIAAPNDPHGQSSPRPKLDLALGAFLRLIVGVGWALVDDRLDDSLRGR